MKKVLIICLSLFSLFILASSVFSQNNSLLNILDIRAATGNNIEMIISALDEQGNPIKGISKDKLKLAIDGKEIKEFSIEPVSSAKNPISVILAIDISGSMHGIPIAEAKKAASVFLDQLEKEDFIALMTFGSNVKSLSGFTGEKYKIREKIGGLIANEQLTWLYQATNDALDNALKSPTSRVAIILLTDGKDEGSPKKEEDVLKKLKGMHVPVYTLGFGPAAQIEYLKTVASISGGYYLFTPKAEELTNLYIMVLDQLKNQYLIKFAFSNPPGEYACVLSFNHTGGEISARRSFLFASNVGTSGMGPLDSKWFKNSLSFILVGLAVLIIVSTRFLYKKIKPVDVQKQKADVDVMINKKIHPLSLNADRLDCSATVIQPTAPKGEVVLQIETKPLPLIFSLMDNVTKEDIKELIIARHNEKRNDLYSEDKVYLLLADNTVSRPDERRIGHARIFKDMEAGIYKIEDLGSAQGTKINDKTCGVNKPCSLESGDIITIGNMVIKYFDRRPVSGTTF